MLGQGDDQKPGVLLKNSKGTAVVREKLSGPISFPVHPNYQIIYDATNTIPDETLTRFTTHTPAVPATPGFGAAGNLDLTNTSSIKGGLYHAEFHAEEGGKEYDKDYYFTIALTYDLEVTKSKDPKDLNEKKYPLTARVPVKIQFTNRGLMEIDEFSAVAYIYDDNGIELYKDSIPWVADPGQELGLGESIDLVFDQFRPSDIGFYELRVLTYYVGDEEATNNTWPWAGQEDHIFEVAP